VAFTVGTVELGSLAHDSLGLKQAPLSWAAAANLNTIGFLIVGLFCVTWSASVLIWKYGRIEERWHRAQYAYPAKRGANG
jgi:high-affinity nickel-transport protein